MSSPVHSEMREFQSDLCTLFPEGTKKQPGLWAHCCFEHDLHYWAGGNKWRRNWVDRELYRCVKATGKKAIADLMYNGVRLGRFSPVKIKSKRWGNAFLAKRKAFQTHSVEEVLQIVDKLQHYDFDPELKNKLLNSIEESMP